MSDPMSERELGEIRARAENGKRQIVVKARQMGLSLAQWQIAVHAVHDRQALLAEIDRLRASIPVMRRAADALEHYGRNSSLECYCCQNSVGHSGGCIVTRLRTAGEG